MSQEKWSRIDDYLVDVLLGPDPALDAALSASEAAGLPPINVAPNQGKLLNLVARMIGARSILEIGTLGGYSTIWFGRALPKDGWLVTLEVDEKHAEVARANIARAGLSERVDLRVGPAIASLAQLAAEDAGPFDLIFIDADKPSNPDYLAYALRLTRRGSVIIADNVVRAGAVTEEASEDANVIGIRRMHAAIAAAPGLDATAIQTVGTKGHDGFALILVTADPAQP